MRVISFISLLVLGTFVSGAPVVESDHPGSVQHNAVDNVININKIQSRDVKLADKKKGDADETQQIQSQNHDKGNTKKTKLICDSKETDVGGSGTGKSKLDVWKEAEMDDFLPKLDDFLDGKKAPWGPYKHSLPKTLGDIADKPSGWTCTRDQCPEPTIDDVEKCEASELGAQANEVMLSLYHFQGCMKTVREFIEHQGSLISDRVKQMMDVLDPIQLDASNAGWAIFISAIMGAVASWLFRFPLTQAIIGFAGAAFGAATATITTIGNKNDQFVTPSIPAGDLAPFVFVPLTGMGYRKIIDHFYTNDKLSVRVSNTFDETAKHVGNLAVRVLEDTPKNLKDTPYSSFDYSAVHLLKGGSFADSIEAKKTDKIESTLGIGATAGIIAPLMDKLVIGKLTKDLLGKKPCDLRGDDKDYPKEFWRLCVGDTAYFFANASYAPSSLRTPFQDLNHQFMNFAKADDKDVFNGLSPIDMVNDSSNSEKKFGWNKAWDASDELMDLLRKAAQDPLGRRISPFNYVILELDLADGDPPNRSREPPSSGELKWSSSGSMDHERLRFMMLQTMRQQKDSHGNEYPFDTAKDLVWKRYPYKWKGKTVKG